MGRLCMEGGGRLCMEGGGVHGEWLLGYERQLAHTAYEGYR